MTFGTLVCTAFTRNPLRSAFTFAAIAAAFCLFGALETNLYQRDTPPADGDTIVVQIDGNTQFPFDAEAAVGALKGVRSVVGVQGIPAQNPKTPTDFLFVVALNHRLVPQTFPGMEITPQIAARWDELHDGAIVDDTTARDMGWHVNDHLTIALQPGFVTRSGASRIEVTIVGLYRNGSVLSGLLVRGDFLRDAFPPRRFAFGTLFVRPKHAREARAVAQRIDEHFRGGESPSISAPLSDLREASQKDAAMIRLVIVGALAISFFTMVLIVANALMQSVRERTGEMAVMRALGFPERTILLLVLAEALAVFAAGALVGLVAANVGFTLGIAGTLRRATVLPAHTISLAIAYVVLFASIAAVLPCWEVSKLRVADALRRL
jgi:putative ABC transport system permease protein